MNDKLVAVIFLIGKEGGYQKKEGGNKNDPSIM